MATGDSPVQGRFAVNLDIPFDFDVFWSGVAPPLNDFQLAPSQTPVPSQAISHYQQMPTSYQLPPSGQLPTPSHMDWPYQQNQDMPTSYQVPSYQAPRSSQLPPPPQLLPCSQALSSSSQVSWSSTQLSSSSQLSSASQRCLDSLREDLRKVYTIAYRHSKKCLERGERPDWAQIWRETRQYPTTEEQQKALKQHFDKFFDMVDKSKAAKRGGAVAARRSQRSIGRRGSQVASKPSSSSLLALSSPSRATVSGVPSIGSIHDNAGQSAPIHPRMPVIRASPSSPPDSRVCTTPGRAVALADPIHLFKGAWNEGVRSEAAPAAALPMVPASAPAPNPLPSSPHTPSSAIDADTGATLTIQRPGIVPGKHVADPDSHRVSLHLAMASKTPLQPSISANALPNTLKSDGSESSALTFVPTVTLSKAARTAIECGSWKGWDYCGVFKWDSGTTDVLPLTGEEILLRSRDQPKRASVHSAKGESPRKAPRAAAFPDLRERWRCRRCGGVANERIATTSNLGKHSKSARCLNNVDTISSS
ncbi:hypothetical protein CF319_g6772 [Tilletia indica]|nr:hypothetical protein CF319_g6772 [Tilletia indica]